jgi:NAD(P)H-nitrite reductase large subunit
VVNFFIHKLTTDSEKVIKQDTARRYDILVIGEEPHVAYNRVGLSSFFEHRKIEDLYLNPKEWVSTGCNYEGIARF